MPTQNKFFRDINLKEYIKQYDGIIVAQSAGAMNCANSAYICPGVVGEAMDAEFERFRLGLGITDLNIIAHYNKNKNYILDGMRFYEDIIHPDSFIVPLYVLTDGSFIYW